MLSTKKLLYKIIEKPLVVEQGTSGNWIYRKWSDGKAEAWGWKARADYSITTVYGNGYYGALASFNFPTNLFTSAPTAFITAVDSSGTWVAVSTISASSVSWYPYSVKSGTYGVAYNFYAVGTWK